MPHLLCAFTLKLNENISLTHILAKSNKEFMKYCLLHICAILVMAEAVILAGEFVKNCNSFMRGLL